MGILRVYIYRGQSLAVPRATPDTQAADGRTMTRPDAPLPSAPSTTLRIPGGGSVELSYTQLAALARDLPDQLERAADEEYRHVERLVDPEGHGLSLGGELDLTTRRRVWWTPGRPAPQPLGVPVLQFTAAPRFDPHVAAVRASRRVPHSFRYRWELVFSRLPELALASCAADDPAAFTELVATSRGDLDALAALLSLKSPDFPKYLSNEVLALARPEVVSAVHELLEAAADSPAVSLPVRGPLIAARPVILDPATSVPVELSSVLLVEVGPHRVSDVDRMIRDAGLVPVRDGMRQGSWFGMAYRLAATPGFGSRIRAAMRLIPVDAVTARMPDEDAQLAMMSVASMFGLPEQEIRTVAQWSALRRTGTP